MNHAESLVQRLQLLDVQRHTVQSMEQALQVLTPEERLVTDMLLIRPKRGNAQALCELLGAEKSTIYRRRKSALAKLESVLTHRAPETEN